MNTATKLIEELALHGSIQEGYAVLTKDTDGYHMRFTRNQHLFRHDLSKDSAPERVEAHWRGYSENLRVLVGPAG